VTASPAPGPSLVVRAPGGLRFEPAELRVPGGAPVEVVFQNRDVQDHTFVVDELPVLMLAGPGQTVRATVSLGRGNRGTFAFYCRIAGHRAGGMEGRLRVG
jgi:nitrite reductase (NO-forming)